jgi:hypothetical protein
MPLKGAADSGQVLRRIPRRSPGVERSRMSAATKARPISKGSKRTSTTRYDVELAQLPGSGLGPARHGRSSSDFPIDDTVVAVSLPLYIASYNPIQLAGRYIERCRHALETGREVVTRRGVVKGSELFRGVLCKLLDTSLRSRTGGILLVLLRCPFTRQDTKCSFKVGKGSRCLFAG